MKVWQLESTGKEHLRLIEQPQPKPGPSQVLIRSQAISLNYRDKAILDGTYPIPITLPLVLASDLAGEVVAVGDGVTRFRSGDKVLSVFKQLWLDGVPTLEANAANLGGPLPGVLAEYVVLPETGVLPYPTYLNPAKASTLPIAAVTAWVGLFKHGQLKPGNTVLVQGSGGVSIFGLQLAVSHGARVIATSRNEDKIDRLRRLGAVEVINTSEKPNWEEEVRSLTSNIGVDQILEVVGGDSVQRSIIAAAWGGHISIIGFLGGKTSTIQLPPVIGKAVNIRGFSVGSRKDTEDLLSFLEQHRIEPVIDAVYDFGKVPDALDHLDRGPFGKIVVELR
jgi:NADPH:quinone reductase-like Zn-dependent oxidoreductase